MTTAGSNGGYVVTQSEGEGLDSVNLSPKVSADMKHLEHKPATNTWSRENKIYYLTAFSTSRHSSSSDTETTFLFYRVGGWS